jgi:hypothetical protein
MANHCRRSYPPLGSGIRPGPPPETGWPTEEPIPRIPRANVDPIRSATDALAVVSAVMDHPMTPQTIVMLLDDDRRGERIVVVNDTDRTADPSTVVEWVCASYAEVTDRALVMATIRPRGATRPGDVDVWLEASALADSFGLELLEWFVVGPAGPECPRDLIGEPDRW